MDCQWTQCVDKYGINKCIEMALDHIDPKNERDYHISFDIDALDRHEAPCTGYSRKCFVFPFFLFQFSIDSIVSNYVFFSVPSIPGSHSSRWFDAAWRHSNNWSNFRKWSSLWFGCGWSGPKDRRRKRCENNGRLGHSIDYRSHGQPSKWQFTIDADWFTKKLN